MSVAPHPDAIDGYVLVRRIGTGGQSEVFLAEDPKHRRQVALKLFSLAAGDGEARRTIDREIRAMASLSVHPNVVQIYNSGTFQGQPYLVMPFYEHGSLLGKIQDTGPQAIDEVLRCARDICSALVALHGRVPVTVHRDIKPHNIFCGDHGYVLGDFGVAGVAVSDHSTTTTSGFTIAYASPEVLEQKKATPASDMYSLGATLYTMIAGRKPFEKTGPIDLPAQILDERPARIERSDLSDALQDIVLKLLEKHPSDRLTAPELRDRLTALSGQPAARIASDDTTMIRPARPGPAAMPPSPMAAPDATSLGFRQRPKRWLAISAAAAALVVVALAIGLLLDRGKPAGQDEQTGVSAQPQIDDLVVLPAPTGLTFDETTRLLTWVPVDGASAYVVIGTTVSGARERLGSVSEAMFEVPTDADDDMCLVVLSAAGSRAAESEPLCREAATAP